MTEIHDPLSLVTRLKAICARRQEMLKQIEMLRQNMPNWTMEPMRLAGLSNQELGSLLSDLEHEEAEAGIRELEDTVDALDQEIDDIEMEIMQHGAPSMDCIETMLALICERVHNNVVTDPEDVFYDHGDARLLSLLQRVHKDVVTLRTSRNGHSKMNGRVVNGHQKELDSTINYIDANASLGNGKEMFNKTG